MSTPEYVETGTRVFRLEEVPDADTPGLTWLVIGVEAGPPLTPRERRLIRRAFLAELAAITAGLPSTPESP